MNKRIMKKIVTVLLVFMSSFSFAQISKDIGEFDAVSVFDRISVQLIPSDENKIEISGSRANDVEIVNKNGTLKVRMALRKLLDGEDVSAKLYFKEIQEINASEGSYVICDEAFNQTSVAINAIEGSEIRLNLDVKKATLRAVTGGILKIKGSATNSEVSIGTGGILQGNQLITEQTTVKITTGGEAQIYATELVDAKVRAGGEVMIFGKPKQINKKITLGGSVEESKR